MSVQQSVKKCEERIKEVLQQIEQGEPDDTMIPLSSDGNVVLRRQRIVLDSDMHPLWAVERVDWYVSLRASEEIIRLVENSLQKQGVEQQVRTSTTMWVFPKTRPKSQGRFVIER